MCNFLPSYPSLGVNLLGHNGNSQDGRMKVLGREHDTPELEWNKWNLIDNVHELERWNPVDFNKKLQ